MGPRAPIDYGGNVGSVANGVNGMLVKQGVKNLFPVRIKAVIDGTSTTLMVGERWMCIDGYVGGGYGPETDDYRGGFVAGFSTAGNTLQWGIYQPIRDRPFLPGSSAAQRLLDEKAFGSAHPGAFNGVFADGTVRIITYSVNLGTFTMACIRNDGQDYNLDDLMK